jgi:hypothetical protein
VTLNYLDQYRITSATLPLGTPVFISLVANAARRETTVLDVDAGMENSGNDSYGSGDASISFQLPTATFSFTGTFSHRINLVDGDNMSHTGLFAGADSQSLMTVVGGQLQAGVVSVLVGDYVTVSVSAGVLSQSSASRGALADTEAQALLNWGIHPFDDSIQIINVTYPGDPVPGNSNVTLPGLIDLLPPRPPTIDVPEPGTLILLGQGIAFWLGTACWRFRRS